MHFIYAESLNHLCLTQLMMTSAATLRMHLLSRLEVGHLEWTPRNQGRI